MKFCEKCESVLKVKKNKETENFELICKCGAVYPINPDELTNVLKIYSCERRPKKNNGKNKTIVLNNEEADLGMTIEMTCPKCDYNKAYFFELPPIYGDEDNVVKYKCSKCGFTYTDDGKIR